MATPHDAHRPASGRLPGLTPCAPRKPPLGRGAPGLTPRAASGRRRRPALPDPRWASGFHPTPRLRRSGCVPDRPRFPPSSTPAGPAPEPEAPRPCRACSTPCAGRPYRSWGRLGHGSLRCPARAAVVAVAAARTHTDGNRSTCLPRPGSRGRRARLLGARGRGRGRAGRPEELGCQGSSAALGPQRPLSWRFVGTERTPGTAAA